MNVAQKVLVLIRWTVLVSLVGYIVTSNFFYIYCGASATIFMLFGLLYYNLLGGKGGGPLEGFRADNTILDPGPIQNLPEVADNLYLESSQSNPAPSTLASPHLVDIVTGRPKGRGSLAIKNPVSLDEILVADYYKENWQNPFGNMLLPEIKYDTDRKSAPPAFNMQVAKQITDNVKRAVQALNPGIQNTNKQLFGDLYNQFMLDQSNRVFYSTPATRVENDQSAFANYLYHDLIFSGKESTVEGGLARIQDNYRYTMY